MKNEIRVAIEAQESTAMWHETARVAMKRRNDGAYAIKAQWMSAYAHAVVEAAMKLAEEGK